MKKDNKKIEKGGREIKIHGNQKHYVVPVDLSRVCILCSKLTAPSEEGVLKERLNGKDVSICYADLRRLNKTSDFYFPALPPKMPKYFNWEGYLKELKNELSVKIIGDKKLKQTLKFIQKTFYKGSANEFLKTFFFGK